MANKKKKAPSARRVGKAILEEIAKQTKRIDALEARREARPARRRRAGNVFDQLFGSDEEE